MRLKKIQDFLTGQGWEFSYVEQDGLGSIDFDYRGVGHHIWEFYDGTYGAESNVRTGGRQEEYDGDYEQTIIDIMKDWK